jgi:hypothetical protein
MWIQQFVNSTSRSQAGLFSLNDAKLPPCGDGGLAVTCRAFTSGLGNQIFILAATIAYAIEHKLPLKIPTKSAGKPVYWDSLFSGLKKYLVDDTRSTTRKQVIGEDDCYNYTLPAGPNLGKVEEIVLDGYFQHPSYTAKHWDTISASMGIQSLQKESYKNAISIHIRMGDYEKVRNTYPRITTEYYIRAIKHIAETTGRWDWELHYCMQEQTSLRVDATMRKIQQTFPSMKLVRIPFHKKDWEQFIHLSCCRHNIIANSTFSLMAAQFNIHKDVIKVYPDAWMKGKDSDSWSYANQRIYAFPEGWTKCRNSKKEEHNLR